MKIFIEVISKDGIHDGVTNGVHDGVDSVDGVDHRECCKGDNKGEGWIMVDNGGTPWVDNQLKIQFQIHWLTIN